MPNKSFLGIMLGIMYVTVSHLSFIFVQQTLIEMYTDVLNLLAEFDTKSSRKDRKFINTLPQVSPKL